MDSKRQDKNPYDLPRSSWFEPVIGLFHYAISFLGHWCGRLVDGLEWLAHHLTGILGLLVMPWRLLPRKAAPATEDTEQLNRPSGLLEWSEWIFAHVVGFLLGAFLLVGRVLLPRKLIEKTESVKEIVAGETIGIFVRIGEHGSQIAEIIFPRRIFWPFYWLFGVLLDLADFLAQWWYSRNFAKLVWALPAIGLTIPLCTSMLLATRYTKPRKIQHYRDALEIAEQEHNEAAMLLFRDKLTQLGFEHLDMVEYNAALEAAKAGELQLAYDRMKALAPVEEPGLLEAHLWIANAIVNGQVSQPDPWQAVAAHVDHALELDPESVWAKRFQVELLLRAGERAQAVVIMESVVKHFPSFHADLCYLYLVQGDLQNARLHAHRAVSHYNDFKRRRRRRPEETGRWTPKGYLRIAGSFALAGEPTKELQVLQEGVELYPSDANLRRALVDVLAGRITIADAADERTQPLIRAICQLDPSHRLAVTLLARGVLARDPEVKRFLDELKRDDLLSVDVYVSVGDAYMVLKQYPSALENYRKAIELEPDSPLALNNLAWLLSQSEQPDLESALEAANRAIQLRPDARFYETRGQIFVQMQRWHEAIDDLQRALNANVPNLGQVHRSLAISYEALGDLEQASAHRTLIKIFEGS